MSDASARLGNLLDLSQLINLRPRESVQGRTVVLRPFDQGDEAVTLALGAVVSGPGTESIWTYVKDGPFTDANHFRDCVLADNNKSTLMYSVNDVQTDNPLGLIIIAVDEDNRTGETGMMLSMTGRRTTAATEGLYLALAKAFEAGLRRVVWKCDSLNEASKKAALRYGFVWEGHFRQHMIVRGRNRDSDWYSMLDAEWPARKAEFEKWLSPGNFDADGRQIETLAEVRKKVAEQAKA